MQSRLPIIVFALVMAAIPFVPGMPPFWIVLLDNIGLAALVAMGLVLLTGALVGLSGLVASLGKPSHEWARARIAMSLRVLAGAGLTLLPWVTAKESRAGVLIGGPVAVRPAPTAAAAAIATVPAGEAVRLLEEYGGCVRIQSDGGATGWVETPSVAQLAPVLRSSS